MWEINCLNRFNEGSLSWIVPYEAGDLKYAYVERTLCLFDYEFKIRSQVTKTYNIPSFSIFYLKKIYEYRKSQWSCPPPPATLSTSPWSCSEWRTSWPPSTRTSRFELFVEDFFIIVGVFNYVGPRRIRPHPGVQIRRPEAVGRGQDAKAGGHLRRRRRVVS